jgi:phosphohistidine phosphatase
VKQLLILRHAESGSVPPGLDDHDRPLTQRGRDAASRVGRLLLAHDLLPQRIICSDAVRTQTTADLMREVIDNTGELIITHKLYLADASNVIDLLSEQPDGCDRVMVIGHNPGLEDLLEQLTHKRRPFYAATLAEVRLGAESWLDIEQGGAVLDNYWPK